MKLQNIIGILLLAAIGCCWAGCSKYLDARPSKSLVVPSTLNDLQALLDNNGVMNLQSPAAGESSADNYYLTSPAYASLWNDAYKNMYLWKEEINGSLFPGDWETGYDQVQMANVVLETIDGIERTPENAMQWDNIKGAALFFRGNAFLKTAYTWALAYDSATAAQDLGIPLRLSSNFNIVSVRATLQETYDRILQDLISAVHLLPVVSSPSTRPNRPAAFALLARTYLAMRNYSKAGLYADSSLLLYNQLIDYNTLNAGNDYPFPQFNTETLFTSAGYSAATDEYTALIDTTLYASYAGNDLRKTLFFRNNGNNAASFRGTYLGMYGLFTGIAVDEIYLTRAECYARNGSVTEALSDLNHLLENRYRSGTFTAINITGREKVIDTILAERRKELLMRDLRWMDLKRLNKEPGRQTVLLRVLDGVTYTLPPNDNRYALPLPAAVIEQTGMPQNPR